MTLLELCEPLFQYVCRVNRSARKGVQADAAQVRAEVKGIMADMKARASTERSLVAAYDRVELPLMFFVDFMVKECGAVGRAWKELAHERNELAGDEKFFDLLEETLRDSRSDAAERLTVFYTCLGLGFTGWYTGQPEFLRKKMLEISHRIRSLMDADQSTRVAPEAYEHVNTADLVQPAGSRLVGVGIALVGMFIVLMAANIAAYYQSKQGLSRALDDIAAAGDARAGEKTP